MHVKVLLFAQARDRARTDRFTIELDEGARLADAIGVIKSQQPVLDDLWPHLAVAVDGVLVDENASLHEGAELALLPPVSGG